MGGTFPDTFTMEEPPPPPPVSPLFLCKASSSADMPFSILKLILKCNCLLFLVIFEMVITQGTKIHSSFIGSSDVSKNGINLNKPFHISNVSYVSKSNRTLSVQCEIIISREPTLTIVFVF